MLNYKIINVFIVIIRVTIILIEKKIIRYCKHAFLNTSYLTTFNNTINSSL